MTAQSGYGNGVATATCPQCTDAWSWVVRYRDGSMLYECLGPRAPHAAWANVTVPLVESMLLIPRRAGLPQVVSQVPQDATPVLFRRRYVELNISSGEQVGPRQNIHCLGYERADSASYVFAFEDGSLLHTSNRNAV